MVTDDVPTNAEIFKYDRTGIRGVVNYQTFGCRVFHEKLPTPDKLTPDVSVLRKTEFGGILKAPNGREIRYWSFSDPNSADPKERGPCFPSPTIRVRQGQIVHSTIDPNKNAHTIHHHGIEPTTMNDGVGHMSFETTEPYTYQFQPASAGTFFYHCHRNTPLHFQMGMKGMLIVDPPEGPGRVFEGGPTYDVEKIWTFDGLDPRWHAIRNHDAGMCGEDVGLNRYEPKYFLCSGAFSQTTLTDPRAVVTAKLGQTILIRILNASYSILRINMPTLDCDWVGCDGHPMGSPAAPWCDRSVYPRAVPWEMVPAQRTDLILQPNRRGNHLVEFEFRHWITGQIENAGRAKLRTRVVVS